jgi:alpha-L-fucosidase 2
MGRNSGVIIPILNAFIAVLALVPTSAASGSAFQQNPAADEFLPKAPVSIASYTAATNTVAMPRTERIRRGIVPKRGMVSTGVDGGTLFSGDGKMMVEVPGNPLSEEVIFHHERVLQPWKRPFEAPKIASVLPQVRQLILAGHYREALELSLKASTDVGLPPGMWNHSLIPPFTMHIEIPATGKPKDYLRSVDFGSGEIKVHWTDNRGDWVRQTFVSRPDHVAVQYLTAPNGQTLDATIAINTEFQRRGFMGSDAPMGRGMTNGVQYERDFNEHRMIVIGRFGPEFGNIGFAGVTRVVPVGGSVRMDGGKLVIAGAQSAILLTRIEWFENYSREQVDALTSSLEQLPTDYATLLAKQRAVQSEIIDRVSMDFGGRSEFGMSSEELLTDQRTRIGYSPALLEQYFDMSRYWLLAEGTGDYPSIEGHLNVNVNLQIAPAAMAAMPEATETFAKWIEELLPDSRKNAENIFGARGALYSVHPDQQQGVLYHFAYNWPHHYWISAGGWAYSPIWDYYLTTGDREFLRQHIVPGLKELALFYEDFLTETDENGNYIFVPSYSPENWPMNSDSAPTVMNAVMDISVCKEVLTHLIEASEVLGTDADLVPKWKAMLAKMPPYLTDTDGALKEWAWPTLAENQDHRHASHLYGVWPGDEIDPDRTPQLAKAAWLADRKRAQGNASGHGISHRALAAARLKDEYLVNMELKQFLEQGYVGPTFRGSHNPYTPPMPDQQGSIPTIMMEMLLYSRPGVIELLPALPPTLTNGSVKGLLVRTFAKVDDLTWNTGTGGVDVTITSRKKQDVTLIVRHGIESISATAGVLAAQPKTDASSCTLHLPEGKPVSLHLTIGSHKPSDWVLNVPPMNGFQ